MSAPSPLPTALPTTEITAGRLHLRPWARYDASALVAACQDPLLQRFTLIPTPYGPEQAETFLVCADQQWAGGQAATFAVLDATTADLLGSVALHGFDTPRTTACVGYWTSAPARGQGVASEALGAVCRWGFGALGLHRLMCLTTTDNVASQRTALRVGFRHEGTARGALELGDGRPRDAWQAALLATD